MEHSRGLVRIFMFFMSAEYEIRSILWLVAKFLGIGGLKKLINYCKNIQILRIFGKTLLKC
jgi:hypothetical protein